MSSDQLNHTFKAADSPDTEQSDQQLWTILPAAGAGRRMGSSVAKQYLKIDGVTILELTLQRLFQRPEIGHIFVVLQGDDQFGESLLAPYENKITIVTGGSERAESVFNGLSALRSLAANNDWVLVHDAARPCVRSDDIGRLLQAIKHHAVGGLLGEPVADTLKKIDYKFTIEETLPRENLWRAYTPQVFRYGLLFEAMDVALRGRCNITDEASAIELAGYAPVVVEGHPDNIKVTRPQDLALVRLFLQYQQSGSA